MKIYTKTGDKGQTSLLGGTTVSKSNIRVEAYGSIDELNAFVAHLKDQLKVERLEDEVLECLDHINKVLFDIGSLLAMESDKYRGKIAEFYPESTKMLENQIDQMDQSLVKLRDFILPGGHPLVSFCHICRTVCRRSERRIVALSEVVEVDNTHIEFINRLSDYFFVLARYIANKLGVEEDKWHE